LQIHRYVENNSRIISLGESPLKLVFIQEVLNTNRKFKQVLAKNKIASDIAYTYFPASKLNKYVYSLFIHKNNILKVVKRDDSEYAFNLDEFILTGITHIIEEVNETVVGHFEFFKLDPLSIINDSKKVYFQDRAETYRSLLTLICFYGGMCATQNLNDEQRINLYEKLFIIGFDTKDQIADDEDNIIIDRLNQLLYRLITNKKDIITKDIYHIYKKNFYKPDIEVKTCLNDDFNIFSNQTNILLKLFIFLTIPEQTFNQSRCLRSCPITNNWQVKCPAEIQEKMVEKGKLYIKEEGKNGLNCNIINLFLMNCIDKLDPEYLDDLIQNLDNPNLKKLFINNSIDFMSMNREISSYAGSLNYNTNIFNNLLNNKLIGNKINETLELFLKTQGLFNNCNYTLPL